MLVMRLSGWKGYKVMAGAIDANLLGKPLMPFTAVFIAARFFCIKAYMPAYILNVDVCGT